MFYAVTIRLRARIYRGQFHISSPLGKAFFPFFKTLLYISAGLFQVILHYRFTFQADTPRVYQITIFLNNLK